MAVAKDRSGHSVALGHPFHCAAAFLDIGGNSSHQKLDDSGAPRTARDCPQISTMRVFAQGIGTEFLAHREKIEVTRHDSICETLSGAGGAAHRPHTRAFCGYPRRMPQTWDWLADDPV
jgi:hypothetical protein